MPFWKSELYVEISPWFPFGKDYQPVSVNRFYDRTLKRIASSCLDLGSEFFFMASPQTGCVGNLPRENFFKYGPDSILNLGFLMILGYSDYMERAVIASLGLIEAAQGLFPGITTCSLWSRGIFHGTTKVIAIASNEPFYDCTDYLKGLVHVLDDSKRFFRTGDSTAYFAEKFGYDRFFIQWEHDSPTDITISRLLAEFELEGTKEIVGDSSDVDFPPFMGAAVQTASMMEM